MLKLILLALILSGCVKARESVEILKENVIEFTPEIPKSIKDKITSNFISASNNIYFDPSIKEHLEGYLMLHNIESNVDLKIINENFVMLSYGVNPLVKFNLFNKQNVTSSYVETYDLSIKEKVYKATIVWDSSKSNQLRFELTNALDQIKGVYLKDQQSFEFSSEAIEIFKILDIQNEVENNILNYMTSSAQNPLINEKVFSFINDKLSSAYSEDVGYQLSEQQKRAIELQMLQSSIFCLPLNIEFTSDTISVKNALNLYIHINNDKSLSNFYSINLSDSIIIDNTEEEVLIKIYNNDLFVSFKDVEYRYDKDLNVLTIHQGIINENLNPAILLQLTDLINEQYLYLYDKNVDIRLLVDSIKKIVEVQ